MAEWEQWEAVQGPRSHCGPSSSVTRRYGGPWPIWGLHEELVRGPMADYVPGSSNGRPVICQHPMSKNSTHQQCEETSKWH
ncbi:unnamed protein product, partial [Staurois parvus]